MKAVHHSLKPALYALGGFFVWSLSDACMKWTSEAHLPFYEIVGFMGLFGALALVLLYAPRGQMRTLWPNKPSHQILRVAVSFAGVSCNSVALKHLPMTMFYIVVFTSPMLVALVASWLLKEHLSVAKIMAVVVGFIGVVIAIDPWNGFGGDWTGYAATMGSVACGVTATIMLRFMTQHETPQSLCFLTAAGQAIIGFGLMLWHAESFPVLLFALMVVMGIFSAAGNLMNVLALKYVNAATVEQFHYSQIIFGVVLGFVIWHDVPTWQTSAGSALIIGAGLYVVTRMHKDGIRARAAQLLNS